MKTSKLSNRDFHSVLYCRLASMDPPYGETDCDMIIQNQIFETLFEVSPDDLSLHPLLAESFSYSSDLRRYTIVLKNNVRFHDNSLLSADDVVFTFSRIMKLRPEKVEFLKSCKKLDNRTIEFTLKKPNSVFLYWLIDPIFSILPKSQEEKLKDDSFRKKPIGSGAFKFKSYSDKKGVILNLFKAYHLGKIEIDNLYFPILDEDEAKQRFLAGELDQLFPYRFKDGTEKRMDFKKIQIVDYRVFYTVKFNSSFYSFSNNPFLKLENRKAFRQLLGIPELHPELKSSILQIAQGFIPWGMPGYSSPQQKDEKVNKHTKNLINFFKKYPLRIGCSSGVDDIKNIVSFFKKRLKEKGIEADFDITEVKSVFEDTRKGKYQASITSNFFRYPDTLSILEQVDKFGYKSKDFDRLIEESRKEANKTKRVEIYKKINQLIEDDLPSIPLFYGAYQHGLFSNKWIIPRLDYVGELFMKYRHIKLNRI